MWWIGTWGLIDTILNQFIKASVSKAIFVYTSIIVVVLVIVYLNPTLLEHFI
jgi:hypothetical protein